MRLLALVCVSSKCVTSIELVNILPTRVLAANALVCSRLDYCNPLFRGLLAFNLHKLQCIQNTLALIVTNHRKYAHVTPILKATPLAACCVPLHVQIHNSKLLPCDSQSYFGPSLSQSIC